MITFLGRRAKLSRVWSVGPILIGLAATVAFGQKQPEAENPTSVAWKYLTASPPGDYVGAERCRSCHKPEFTEFSKTAHARVAVPSKDYITGCEACHGSGKAHSDAEEAARGSDAKITATLKQFPTFAFATPENAAWILGHVPLTPKGGLP